MSAITIRNVPAEISDKLKKHAEARGQSLQQFLLNELRETAERSTLEERLREVLGRHANIRASREDVLRAVEEARQDREE